MGKLITLEQPEPFESYLTGDVSGKIPGVILIHEVWGLNDHIKDVSDRLATEGYLVLAPDLLSQTGITEAISPDIMRQAADPATRDEAQKKLRAAMAPIQSPEFAKATVRKLRAAFDYLTQHTSGQVGVIGFCFGGTYSFALAVAEPKLAAAVAFYGHADHAAEDISKVECPVLAFYGERDSRLIEALPGLRDKMDQAGKDFRHKVYPETGHAFFNDTNPNTYNQAAAEDAWQETLEFLSENLR